MKEPTQYEMIIRYMRSYGSLTSLEASHMLNITKLTTRVSEMKRMGIQFVVVEDQNGRSRFNHYSLAQTEQNNKVIMERIFNAKQNLKGNDTDE